MRCLGTPILATTLRCLAPFKKVNHCHCDGFLGRQVDGVRYVQAPLSMLGASELVALCVWSLGGRRALLLKVK